MPENEFDLYLSLLSRLLQLDAGQREEIADELRDHLEERLAELSAEGVPRDAAVRRALDEFGDAAGLAAEFRHISRLHTRRLLMRWTLGTTAFAALFAVLASAFWPQPPGAPAPQRADAQDVEAPGFAGGGLDAAPPKRPTIPSRTGDPSQNVELEKKLSQRLEGVSWEDETVEDLIKRISAEIKADVVVDTKFFEAEAYDTKTKVSLVLGYSRISARTALELVLEKAGMTNAAVTFRDGLIYLTNRDNDRYVEVYNCRDLLEVGKPGGLMGMGMEGAEMDMAAGAAALGGGGRGSRFGGGSFGGESAAQIPASSQKARQLISVLSETIRTTAPSSGPSAAAEYNGLLVITASNEAHREIRQLLERMRSANREGSAAKGKAGKAPARTPAGALPGRGGARPSDRDGFGTKPHKH